MADTCIHRDEFSRSAQGRQTAASALRLFAKVQPFRKRALNISYVHFMGLYLCAKAIAAIKQRHAELKEKALSKLDDASLLDAGLTPCKSD